MPSLALLPRHKAAKLLLLAASALAPTLLCAETCITQSQMKAEDRDSIAAAARSLASLVQANDASGLRQRTLPEYAKDFSGMSSLVGGTAPKMTGATLQVEQVYVLDATNLKSLADGTNQDAQFFCSLNKSAAEANFLIPSLPPGRYAFAMVSAKGNKSPERLSFLLKQSTGATDAAWAMAGFYPRPLSAAGHDGLWYWTQARTLVRSKQLWAAYLFYQQAQALLLPAPFVSSTHLDKLRKEISASAPPALSDGISADVPLVVKAPAKVTGPAEFRFTDLTTDDSLNTDKIDVLAHLAPEPPPEPTSSGEKPKGEAKADSKLASATLSPKDRNTAAMSALLAAYPELRASFHGVWIFADSPGKSPFITEQPMANIP